MSEFVKNNKLFLFSLALYFVIRLINLTKPPLFNDEAIYLDWGFREIHHPGFLYYSLYDGKEPFLMWIFGIMESFLNPVFAGRIVSVFAGFVTLAGLYKISKTLFNKQVALISAIFYTFIPIFSFYDRQALMESSIAAVGVWSFYFLYNFLERKSNKYSIGLGITLGIGFFIKTSAAIFLVCALFLITISILKKKDRNLINKLFVMLTAFFISIFLLIINSQFWQTLGTNSRFVFSLKELLSFPIATWINSVAANLQIAFFYLTPIVFIAFIFGTYKLFKKQTLFFIFFFFALLIETFTTKNASIRYFLPFLPFIIIPVSYFAYSVYKKEKLYGRLFFAALIFLPIALTLLQVASQPKFIMLMGKFTPYYNSDYLNGFSSGYGVNEAIDYVKQFSNGKDIAVTFAENAGNPESAIMVRFAKDQHIKPIYLDEKLIGIDTSGYSCLSLPTPLLFVSRDNQQGGMDKFLEKIHTIKNPYGTNTIGIYTTKRDCKGKTVNLSPKQN